MHPYITLECSLVIYHWEIETLAICLIFVLHLRWDPGYLLRHCVGMLQISELCPFLVYSLSASHRCKSYSCPDFEEI
jgi:hypothetical protein